MEILYDGTAVLKNHSNVLITWYVIKRDFMTTIYLYKQTYKTLNYVDLHLTNCKCSFIDHKTQL